MPQTPNPVAYLAPEIYAISSTFVYEEIAGLERLGCQVVPFSVLRPAVPAHGQDALKQRTEVLYGRRTAALGWLGDALALLARHPAGVLRAAGWLVADLWHVGLHRKEAWKLGYQWLAGAHLARRLRSHGCQHLHIHFAHVPTQIGMYAAAMAGLPYTVMAHANDIFERQLLLRQKAARSLKLLTISAFNARYLLGLGVPAHQLAVVRCGVAPALSAAPPVRPPAVPGQPFRLGSLGRLVEKKGMDTLIAALQQVRAQGHDAVLEIAGDGPLRAALQAQVAELGLQQAVTFLGAMGHDQVQAWLGRLDAFVLACKQDAQGDMDGIPVALMEAMAQGLPVVSTRLSGVPELVMDGQTGWLAAPDDPADLARQLVDLLQSPERRQALAQAGARHVATEFSQALNLQRLLQQFSAPRPEPSRGLTA